ncbi:xanthine dehydrogenase small subunit [Agromyces sp. Leaf222]|uniref:xanthine dehydrogenase small subunit n=1 Tax=Agromyces sp. Leaf222 TaxID=1735688 RepID=UPI0006F26BCA|nr:FAD binding domain-containing protein [Agromyces sp. Leaf222]KQM82713.1 xanthine dehydrogenase small subunit [Agromyces sp. Leaf222]
MEHIDVTVNGALRPLLGIRAHTTALDWLRESGLTGAKEGCAEGECGACAVLLATSDERGGTVWTAVNACLLPAAALDGQEVVTAEGLGSPEALHPVQARLAEAGGSQCGYCTPGFACSMAAEFYRPERAPSAAAAGASAGAGGEADASAGDCGPNGFDLHALSGNLCRCTGYRPIRDAAYALGEPEPDDPLAERRRQPAPKPRTTRLDGPGGRFVRPRSFEDALRILREEPGAAVVAGSTDWGVEVNLRGRRAPLTVAIDHLPELRDVTFGDAAIEIGAALPLADVERRLEGRVPVLGELFPQFASPLIRNRATIGGNLGTASPVGDTSPVLLALAARVVLVSVDGEREVDLADYFTGYRETLRRPDELIRSVRIPLPLARLTAFHKIAKRRFDDISSVAVGFALDLDGDVIASARIGLGGVAATPLRARATEAHLVGRPWNLETVRDAASVLESEGTPMSDHRASAEYRSLMLGAALLKLFRTSPRTAEGASA